MLTLLSSTQVPANGTPAAGSPGKDDADAKAAKDTAAAINASTAADADMDAHGEADAPGEVEEAEVKGVEEGTAKIDLNGETFVRSLVVYQADFLSS